MSALIIIFVLWYLVGETITWLWCESLGIQPDQYESDEVREMRFVVLMSPVVIASIAVAYLTRAVYRAGYRAGLWSKPSDNPMDYIP